MEDVGHVLTVTVTARRPGYRPGTFRTAGVSVPKLASRLTASLAKKAIIQGQHAAMTLVLAVADRARPTGRLTVRDGARTIRTVRLTASYAGSDLVTGATSKVVKLTVRRKK
ncbi:hypothetical protein JCM10369A_25750 [Nocardioides pyridinolyticus]